MEYKLWLKAFTWKHEGEPSDPIIVQTDVRGPSAPRIAYYLYLQGQIIELSLQIYELVHTN